PQRPGGEAARRVRPRAAAARGRAGEAAGGWRSADAGALRRRRAGGAAPGGLLPAVPRRGLARICRERRLPDRAVAATLPAIEGRPDAPRRRNRRPLELA